MFGIYAAVADALVSRREHAETDEALSGAVSRLLNDEWRMTRQHGARGLRGRAATALLVLLATGHDAGMLKRHASNVDGRWGKPGMPVHEPLIARLSLRSELHADLLADLASLAEGSRKLRIGADEKAKLLVGLGRLIKPISPPDANAVFNAAVEAASELDSEIMAQLRMIDVLAEKAGADFDRPRETAAELTALVNDAAIRLDGYEHFPWDASMSALARLDVPTALAAAARWDDAGVARLGESLPPLLKRGLAEKRLSPALAAAFDLILADDGEVLAAVLESAREVGGRAADDLIEELARDVVLERDRRHVKGLPECIASEGYSGPWASALARQSQFSRSLPKEKGRARAEPISAARDRKAPSAGRVWARELLLDGTALAAEAESLQRALRDEGTFVGRNDILASARASVPPRDRVPHLKALSQASDGDEFRSCLDALLAAVVDWWSSPAVQAWATAELPTVIVEELPYLARWVHHGEETLTNWLDRAGLTGAAREACLLAGLGRHVGQMGADQVFALTGIVGATLAPSQAAELTDWYVRRLADRIPPDDREPKVPAADLPATPDDAVARFIFAYLGDPDLRLRWRAGHAMRRLARLGEVTPLAALAAEYDRTIEPAFRDPKLPFYWLAARLWFVIAWDRIAGERPDVAAPLGPRLLQIAFDQDLPHLLIRDFARDACLKLVAAGRLQLDPTTLDQLGKVNTTLLPRMEVAKQVPRRFGMDEPERRFTFDSMDTLPYWYQPMIQAFASVSTDQFLTVAEAWIIDRWGYPGNARYSEQDRRSGRSTNDDWREQSNRHGSTPTVERLSTHLEWHAMWCTAGELLQTEPLPIRDEDDWDEIGRKLRREELTEPPLWLADMVVPTPLEPRFWAGDRRPLPEWRPDVGEAIHRRELLPEIWPDYVVVDANIEVRTGDRVDNAHVSTSMVEPSTGAALLRALQTMEDAWDYKMPDEDEHHELEEAPYRFVGWLRRSSRDGGCDEKDPLRGAASVIAVRPGRRVIEACGLSRDADGQPIWRNSTADAPMFFYEVWGERERDNERFTSGLMVRGHRLLVHKAQLKAYLAREGLDLLAEVEVTRRDRRERDYLDEESEEDTEARFDRLYRLRRGGELDIAEGRAGTWSDDRPPA